MKSKFKEMNFEEMSNFLLAEAERAPGTGVKVTKEFLIHMSNIVYHLHMTNEKLEELEARIRILELRSMRF